MKNGLAFYNGVNCILGQCIPHLYFSLSIFMLAMTLIDLMSELCQTWNAVPVDSENRHNKLF